MSHEIRISHSFPPNYQDNKTYLAEVHSILESENVEIDPAKIYFRQLNDDDIEEIKLLHKEWFPVKYPDTFFEEKLPSGIVKTLLAAYDVMINQRKHSLILGCLTYEFRALEFGLSRFTLADLCGDHYGIYIMTFGVINEARSKGVGSALIKRIIEIANTEKTVKYVFLDVVVYNDQGIRCYEKNGFEIIDRKFNHYEFFEEKYDCLTYCRYVNDGKRPRTVAEMFECCKCLWEIPKKSFKNLKGTISQLTEGRRKYTNTKYKFLKV